MVILVTLVLQGLTLPWIIRRLKLKEDKLEIPAEIQAQQIHQLLLKLSIARLEENYPELLKNNELVKNFRLNLEDEMNFSQLILNS